MQTLAEQQSAALDRSSLEAASAASIVATDVPASVPSFKSFDHITDPRIRRAKDYEQFLQCALERIPEMRDRIMVEIGWARGEQERSQPSDRERISRVLEQWQATDGLLCQDIADDLEMPYATVYKHLRQMLENGSVAAYTRPGRHGNKTMVLYSLAS
ncbi:MAG: helix-turn-helix domain-containing protein [Pyrinomonadaceae bacterium]